MRLNFCFRQTLLLSCLFLVVLSSCRYKVKEDPHWDANYLTPILKSRVSLEDILTDTTLVQTNSDNSLTLVYRDTVADLLLSEYVTVPDTSLEGTVTLDSITLDTDSITQRITLEDIANSLVAQGNNIGNTILNNDGGSIFFLPSISGITSGTVAIDAEDLFDEADLKEGEIVVKIENFLPVAINSATFNLRNAGMLNDTLLKKTMGPIAPFGGVAIDSSSLAGKTVESDLAGELENIETAAGTNVPINLQDYVEITIVVQNLKASRATAVFPAQTVVNSVSNAKYDFGPDIVVTRMGVKSGILKVTAISTINDTLVFNYSLPTAIKDGQPVNVTSVLNPAPIGDTIVNDKEFDLAEHFIDLTIDGDSVNIFPQILRGDLRYSGKKVTMDLQDSIYVFYGLLNIIPSYIEGYLGKEKFEFEDTLNLDFFNSILGGSMELVQPKVQLTFLNSIGIDGELKINRIEARNSRTNQSVRLSGSAVNQPTYIPGPKLPNLYQAVTSQISLTNQNSNINDFVSAMPDIITFDMEVDVNKNGNPALKDNFATDQSRISAFLDMEVPIHGLANDLMLVDTLDLNTSESSIPAEAIDGTLRLFLENYFPCEAVVQVYFYNAGGGIVDSLFSNGPAFVPAAIPGSQGFTEEPATTKLETFFEASDLSALQTNATRAVIHFNLSTRPLGQNIKLYSNYGIDFKLVGDFRYQVGF